MATEKENQTPGKIIIVCSDDETRFAFAASLRRLKLFMNLFNQFIDGITSLDEERDPDFNAKYVGFTDLAIKGIFEIYGKPGTYDADLNFLNMSLVENAWQKVTAADILGKKGK